MEEVRPIERERVLHGRTYKIKPATEEHAFYVTVNDVLKDGHLRPFEIFINTKNASQYDWVTALTRLMSALFRKGGSYEFMIEELEQVIAPDGGYWDKGVWYGSVIAHIGAVLREHCKWLSDLNLEKINEVIRSGHIDQDRVGISGTGEVSSDGVDFVSPVNN